MVGLVVLFLGELSLIRSEVFLVEEDERVVVVVLVLVEFEALDVEFSFLVLDVEFSFLSSILILDKVLAELLVDFTILVWFLLVERLGFASLVWFLEDDELGLIGLVWFLADKEVEVVEVFFFTGWPSFSASNNFLLPRNFEL